jgi:hypothetical protein
VKAVLDFTAKQCTIYIDGASTGTISLSAITSGGKYNVQLGVGPYSYAVSNRYKNITIKNDGGQPITVTLGTGEYDIRSLTGGTTFIDSNGNPTNYSQSLGAYPNTNEWDKYIVKSTLGGRIMAGDMNVWNWNDFFSLCQEQVADGFNGNTNVTGYKVKRGATLDGLGIQSYTAVWTNAGFRPVLQYSE